MRGKLLLIGNPKYHRQIMGSDIDVFYFGNIKKSVGTENGLAILLDKSSKPNLFLLGGNFSESTYLVKTEYVRGLDKVAMSELIKMHLLLNLKILGLLKQSVSLHTVEIPPDTICHHIT